MKRILIKCGSASLASFLTVSLLLPRVSTDSLRNKEEPCLICFKAKQTRDSIPINSNKVVDLFELIHSDVWGPYSIHFSCGASYLLTIVNDCSRGVWVHLMVD